MIKDYNGDILKSNATAICHQVNCKGVMGAGLALQIINLYPDVFKAYKNKCLEYNLLGQIQCVNISEDRYIVNMFCQFDYGYMKRYTDYVALKTALTVLAAKMNGSTIAFPYKLGCGLAGGDWNIVKNIIAEVFENYSGEIQIWHFDQENSSNL